MANYRMNKVQHRVFWNNESPSLYKTIPVHERILISVLKKILRMKKYRLNVALFRNEKFKVYIPANTKY